MSDLKCQACGTGNDDTRVFCQECGARLERVEGQVGSAPVATAVPQIARPKGFSPQSTPIRGPRRSIFTLLAVAIRDLIVLGAVAALLAAVILAFRVPADMPKWPAPDPSSALKLRTQLDQLSKSGQGAQIIISQDQINSLLASSLKPGGEAGAPISFQGAGVICGEGTFDFIIGEGVYSQRLVMRLRFMPVVRASGLNVRATSGWVGHLPIHPLLLVVLEKILSPAYAAMEPDIALVRDAGVANIQPGRVILSWAKP